MKDLIFATRSSVNARNWYAALALGLTLPDLCGRLENPAGPSPERYAAWFDRYVARRYMRGGRQILDGRDCYALRCGFLQPGEVEAVDDRAREVLDSVLVITAPEGWIIHLNLREGRLQIQVDILVSDICRGVDTWLAANANDEAVQERIQRLGRIHDANLSVPA